MVGIVKVADTFISRFLGLLPIKVLKENNGLLLKPCKQVHTFLMKYPIDVIFLSDENIIEHIEYNLVPNKVSRYVKSAVKTLEINSGVAIRYNLDVGDMLNIKDANKEN
ncbi:MAG: hypothetical protein A2Y15_09835 [Clostridiales bacterium GWF2_36_10]|nr:MAG: hypothetical protein A2Y15_09835 [Clostridiales bacterium GWF2_36_10]